MANNLTESMRNNMDALRENNEELNEDNWWADKAKKAVGAVTGKFSQKQKSKAENRARATELVNAYKKALGSGLGETFGELLEWMKSSETAQPAVIKDAIKRMQPKPKVGDRISIAQARDYFINHTASESLGISKAKDRNVPTQRTPSNTAGGGFSDDEVSQLKALLAQMNK